MMYLKFLFFFLTIIHYNAYSCDPVMLKKCNIKDSIEIDHNSLKELTAIVKVYSQLLSTAADSTGKHSCFQNGFAFFYLNSERGKTTCDKHIKVIKNNVTQLTSNNSEEWNSIKSEKFRVKLQALKKRVDEKLEVYLKKHQ